MNRRKLRTKPIDSCQSACNKNESILLRKLSLFVMDVLIIVSKGFVLEELELGGRDRMDRWIDSL